MRRSTAAGVPRRSPAVRRTAARRSASARAAGPRPRRTSSSPTFDGPLALLLSLIEARQLDVLTVPLGGLADAYLDALAALEADRLGNVSAFVAVACAAHPHQEPGDAAAPRRRRPDRRSRTRAPDPEAELRARLLLYRAYRDAGQRLAEGALARIGLFRREPAAARAAGLAGAAPAPTRRRSTRRGWSSALDAPRRDRAAAGAAARGHAAHDHAHRAGRDHPRGPARRARRSSSRTCCAGVRDRVVDRGHVPRDARAHEAARDRRRAGRAVGPDRRPRDDGRGARRRRLPDVDAEDARSTSPWSRSHDRRRDAELDGRRRRRAGAEPRRRRRPTTSGRRSS